MASKPYLTSQDLLDSVKRRISFPAYQATFTDSDILALANEEMAISQVPSVLEYHEGYFVYRVDVPLMPYTSRYQIPDRAIGMRLRDIAYVDQSQNIYEMTRIDDSDKTYFQRAVGENTSIGKFYIENNEIVLTPSVQASPTGSLAFWIFLRPNQLVQNDRAATIQSFSKDLTLNNANITTGDQIQISRFNGTPQQRTNTYTAVNTTITGGNTGANTSLTMSVPHGQTVGSTFTVFISENSGSTPVINGTWIATATGANTFTIPSPTSVLGSNGNVAINNQFSIGSSTTQTALNLGFTLTSSYSGSLTTSNPSTNVCRLIYSDIGLQITLTLANSFGITKDDSIILANFDQLPTTWQNPDTGVISPLFTTGALVDILQTKAGHRTYNFDIPLVSFQGTVGTFNTSDLMKYNSIGDGTVQTFLPIVVGDYICLSNESIIPQIPPDMHTVLAERTAVRILQALGDIQGVQVSASKIQQMETQQGILIDNRVDDAPRKLLNRHSILRYGKIGGIRRRI